MHRATRCPNHDGLCPIDPHDLGINTVVVECLDLVSLQPFELADPPHPLQISAPNAPVDCKADNGDDAYDPPKDQTVRHTRMYHLHIPNKISTYLLISGAMAALFPMPRVAIGQQRAVKISSDCDVQFLVGVCAVYPRHTNRSPSPCRLAPAK